jgi:hypothetical protein
LGAPFNASWRTTSGTSFPIPFPWNSSVKVTRDQLPFSSGSTVMLALGLSGPSTPRAAQLLGGSSAVISCVYLKL